MINKHELRKFYKSVRKSFSINEKIYFENRIFSFFINSELYKNTDTLLVYVSFNNEVDTSKIITRALSDGKIVAVPYCIGKEMKFLIIDSPDNLSEGKFGIPTADPETNEFINDFHNSLCIVPALSFDPYGNRLGYGGGFYDRFLENNPIITVGLCFGRCISQKIPNEKFDVNIQYIITENGLMKSVKEVTA